MKNFLIGLAMFLIIGFSIAGLSGGLNPLGTESVLSDKVIPDKDYQELKVVLEKGGVVLTDDKGLDLPLDVSWVENKCTENFFQDTNSKTGEAIGEPVLTGTTCEYALYKENLFGGATIQVTYSINAKVEDKQKQLDDAIQNKINEVKEVWEARQARDEAKALEEKQTGTTNMKSDAKPTEPIK